MASALPYTWQSYNYYNVQKNFYKQTLPLNQLLPTYKNQNNNAQKKKKKIISYFALIVWTPANEHNLFVLHTHAASKFSVVNQFNCATYACSSRQNKYISTSRIEQLIKNLMIIRKKKKTRKSLPIAPIVISSPAKPKKGDYTTTASLSRSFRQKGETRMRDISGERERKIPYDITP